MKYMKRTNLISLFAFLVALFVHTSATFAADESSEGILYYRIGYYQQAEDILLKDLAAEKGDKTEIYYYLGNVEFKLGNMEKAAEYYQQGAALDEKDPFNQIGLLKLKIQSDPEAAAEGFKQIQKKNKKKPMVACEIGRAYLDCKQPDAASEYQGMAYERDNQFAPAHILWADIMNYQGDGGVAATYYEQAIMADPESYEAYVKYSRVINYVNFDAAVERLKELKTKNPALSLADKELSEIYYRKNRFEEAATAYEDYIKAGNYTQDDLKQYAVTLLFAGRHDESLKIAQEGLKSEPNDPAFSRMAMYNLIDLQRYDEARAAADHFFNESTNPQFNFYDYIYEGRLLDAEQRFEEAAVAYTKAAESDSSQVEMYKMASQSYENAKMILKSVEVYEKYVEMVGKGDKEADNLMDLGRKYYSVAIVEDTTVTDSIKNIYLAKAVDVFKKVTTIEPTNYRGYFWEGHAASRLDPECKGTDARDAYMKALEIAKEAVKENEQFNSVIVTCYNYLCVYYYMQYEANKVESDKQECVKYAAELLTLDPTNNVATQLLTIYGGDTAQPADDQAATGEAQSATAGEAQPAAGGEAAAQ